MPDDRQETVEAAERKMKRKCKACGGSGEDLQHRSGPLSCPFCEGTGLEEIVQERTKEAWAPLKITPK